MILKLSKDKKLTFYRKNPIYIGEKDFNTIEVLISPTIDGNETNELNFILHLVNKDGEYLHIDLDKEIKEDIIVGSTQITTNITSIAQKFSVYIEMIRGNDEIIGKTNVLEIEVNPLPDEQGEITPEEIERRSTIISQDNPPESSHKKYKLNALWINYTDKTQFVLTSIDESQAPEKYTYTWKRNNNHVVVSTETAPEYTPDNVDYKYSNGDMWVQTDLDSDKILSISVCTEYTKELIDDETWRYNYTWAILNSGITSYNELNNKPQINNITLQGNKTSNELGLQDKLTAGENITISSDNVISAEGGVTSYEDLTDKPRINGYVLSGNKSSDDLRLMSINTITGVPRNDIHVNYPYDFNKNVYLERDIYINEDSYNNCYRVGVQDNFFRDYSGTMGVIKHGEYDFDSIEKNYAFCGCLLFSKSELRHAPDFINQFRNTNIRIFQLFTPKFGTGDISLMIRCIIGTDNTSLELRTFYQAATATLQQDGSYIVSNQSDWQEIGGGSQIVSGVVNANGTITFTDSDGNTFTTTGSSVIGPQGDDYVLTTQDKSDIANIVLSELPTTQGVLYGN